MGLIGEGRIDRFPQEDVRLRRGLASSFVPFIGARFGVNLGSNFLITTGVITADHFVSTVLTGTAPFTVASTTLVTNLNADRLDGLHAADLTLAGLADVTIVTPSNGQSLIYNTGTGKWNNAFPALATLSDVALSTPQTGEVLIYDLPSNKWVGYTKPFVPYAGAKTDVDLGAYQMKATYFQTATAPTANSTGTVVIVAKDTNLLTANTGWLPMKRSDGTIVYVPYWV